jgi:hypothetical protein
MIAPEAHMANVEDGPVTVLETSDPGLLATAQSLLEGEDIECFVANEATNSLLHLQAFGTAKIQVAAEDAARAREILSALAEPPPAEE